LKDLEAWYTRIMKGKVTSVRPTYRLSGSPAIISNPENPTMKMMRKMYGENKDEQMTPQKLEIDPTHPLIIKLFNAKSVNETLAVTCAEAIFNHALIAAGLLEDPRTMSQNLTNLLESSLSGVDSAPK
jgi:TNF receptor-associated protein 1